MLQRFEKTQKHINGNLSKHTNNVKYVHCIQRYVCVYLESIKHFHTLRDINIFLHMYHIYIYILNFIQKNSPPNKPNHQPKIASSKPLIFFRIDFQSQSVPAASTSHVASAGRALHSMEVPSKKGIVPLERSPKRWSGE